MKRIHHSCLKWRSKPFMYTKFWTVLSPTFGVQPQGLLHKWVSFPAYPLVLVLSTWPFLLGRVFLAVEPHGFGLQVSLQRRFPHETQLHFLWLARKSKYVVLYFLLPWLSSSIVAQLHTWYFILFSLQNNKIPL